MTWEPPKGKRYVAWHTGWVVRKGRKNWILKNRATGEVVKVSIEELPLYDVSLVTAWGYQRTPGFLKTKRKPKR